MEVSAGTPRGRSYRLSSQSLFCQNTASSGQVRYDSETREIKLVRALVSDKPGHNLWAVMKHDKSLGIINFGKVAGLRREAKKSMDVVQVPGLTEAEREEIKAQAVDLAGDALAEERVEGTALTSEIADDVSESDGDGVLEPSAPLPFRARER